MKEFGMKMARVAVAGLAVMFAVGGAAPGLAQATGSIHGKVVTPVGLPVKDGTVRLTTDRSNGPAVSKKYDYSFPLDADGQYKGDGIKPGNYVAVAFQGPVSVDFIMNLAVAAGADKVADFDMTRKEYIEKMSPEEKTALEDLKKKNAAAMEANSKIGNLNAMLKQSRDDIKAGHFEPALKAMTDATAAKPDEAILWDTLGDAQLGDATAADKAAKAAKATDAQLPGKYAAAVTSYEKALSLNAAAAKPSAELTATVENQLGQAYGKQAQLGEKEKAKQSADAYEAAAKADPKGAGMYYFNEAATMFNANAMDDAASAADKAIAADPAKAEAYYIKAQALIQKASVDAKGKITAPPGCVDAYQKYLELAPTGAHAEEVKGILTGIGEPIKSSFKAGKK